MPDSNPRYVKIPRPDSIIFFNKAIKKHEQVLSIKQISNIIYEITRVENDIINVYLTNVYIVSIADVQEIITNSNNYKINVIVTMSAWNSYTLEAKKFAKDQNIALFTLKEFMGALNYYGSKFINYEIKEKD